MKKDQLSLWENRDKPEIKPYKVERKENEIIIYFEVKNEKGIVLELIFHFYSPKSFKQEKIIRQAPEGLRVFNSYASQEENTWINKKIYSEILKIAKAIAYNYFETKPEDNNPIKNEQLNLFTEEN
ncbi:MAG: hypothetical protein KatS3mg095_0614 [Candidatus Parcubacteria bacterium]|nr:MAG: hypothetical protein KatS3mg095_0614 [Candidatus Parcubacteria bacterium]